MTDPGILLSLLTLGLVSGAHCIGMCGGIMGALTMAIPADARSKRWLILVAYNVGRILSYGVMGLLAGMFAEQFSALGGGTILRILAGVLLITMGLYLADWWRGLTKLEMLGRYVWVYIQPLGKQLMPVDTLPKALLLGALWGWLPCGLVYAALAMSMTQPAPALAASAMLAFGVGTLPAVLAAGVAAQQLTRILQQRQVRLGLALVVIGFGVWTIWGAVGHTHQHSNGNHTHGQPVDSHIDHTAMDHNSTDHSAMHLKETNHAAVGHSAHESIQNSHESIQNGHESIEGEQAEHHHGAMSSAEGSMMNHAPAEALERQRTDGNDDLRDNSNAQIEIHSAMSSSAAEKPRGAPVNHHH
jgi:sulfite exporter TauE/SafE